MGLGLWEFDPRVILAQVTAASVPGNRLPLPSLPPPPPNAPLLPPPPSRPPLHDVSTSAERRFRKKAAGRHVPPRHARFRVWPLMEYLSVPQRRAAAPIASRRRIDVRKKAAGRHVPPRRSRVRLPPWGSAGSGRGAAQRRANSSETTYRRPASGVSEKKPPVGTYCPDGKISGAKSPETTYRRPASGVPGTPRAHLAHLLTRFPEKTPLRHLPTLNWSRAAAVTPSRCIDVPRPAFRETARTTYLRPTSKASVHFHSDLLVLDRPTTMYCILASGALDPRMFLACDIAQARLHARQTRYLNHADETYFRDRGQTPNTFHSSTSRASLRVVYRRLPSTEFSTQRPSREN
ncbi:hypothetical protein C8R46DRAFT_1226476 [Mycena filopes]|nr:hypothetical protein C8R46DRAFT_1226470 [Mycena filopes]KAJ7156238.1 hypothetical protein C8R46DRAFT_1226472 [Mycena filopes]KAJ7156240.1 hypothetical protein C8R46DRAFT_1226474 [Mycena filopes]KAJ7156243.1 hypothetical protein C8R46DRAFT_1226476 [Mycena filopes]